ncbi:MAG: nucleotidyl transferase AbiEii/AbiGii toxin family protein [Polyangiaceae bacterium]
MHLFPDFRDLLEAFVASGVEFVLIGGYAVIFHGRPRATKDIDLLVDLDPANLARLGAALDAYGAPANVAAAARALKHDEVVYFGVSPLRVDILGSASGIDFAVVRAHAIVTKLDGLTVRVIAIEDLITNKRASGRQATSRTFGSSSAFETTSRTEQLVLRRREARSLDGHRWRCLGVGGALHSVGAFAVRADALC